ncbi:MAG: hypothetical protein M0Q13_11860 [Methanothrix sp.]|jgi:hypothetical protein|nr:hypothetical protein [Methanothrix sp.]
MNINTNTKIIEDMACSNPLEAAIGVMPNKEAENEKDLIEGIVIGLKDFAKGRYTVFEDDDEMEAHLMGL